MPSIWNILFFKVSFLRLRSSLESVSISLEVVPAPTSLKTCLFLTELMRGHQTRSSHKISSLEWFTINGNFAEHIYPEWDCLRFLKNDLQSVVRCIWSNGSIKWLILSEYLNVWNAAGIGQFFSSALWHWYICGWHR